MSAHPTGRGWARQIIGDEIAMEMAQLTAEIVVEHDSTTDQCPACDGLAIETFGYCVSCAIGVQESLFRASCSVGQMLTVWSASTTTGRAQSILFRRLKHLARVANSIATEVSWGFQPCDPEHVCRTPETVLRACIAVQLALAETDPQRRPSRAQLAQLALRCRDELNRIGLPS